MESKSIANTQNIINSRDLFTRINRLRQELNYRFSEEYSRELKALTAFEKNIEPVASISTYGSGADLVRDSYFDEYQREMGKPGAAASQKTAFSPVDFGGVIYWLGR